MPDEPKVETGSEASGEQPAPEVETPQIETPSEAPAPEVVAKQKAGDACTCPDGRPGTLHDQEGTLVCLANQG
jgi:hypothetical protein